MEFQIGSKVAYSVQFLKSIGESHGDLSHDRGIITGFMELSKECILAEIDWNRDSPKRVNTKNLAIVGPNRKFCNVD